MFSGEGIERERAKIKNRDTTKIHIYGHDVQCLNEAVAGLRQMHKQYEFKPGQPNALNRLTASEVGAIIFIKLTSD